MPQGIVGDSHPTQLPQTQVDPRQLEEEQKMARFSKSAEFKRLKGHLEQRIEFYQTFLPGGDAVTAKNKTDLDGMWMVANSIVGELKSIIAAYEQAAEAAKDGK